MSSILSLRRDRPDEYRRKVFDDPGWFAREILGINLYDRQIEMLENLRDAATADRTKGESTQVTVSGANGVGKDFTIGRVVIPWWHEVFDPAKVIITGPTGRQVDDIVWQECRAAFMTARHPLRGRMLPKASRWEVGPDSFALGFATDKPYNILGFHSPKLLVVVTEAHNMGEEHFTNLRRLLPTVMLLSGNPLAEAGSFYLSHHDLAATYRTISISAWDSPNVRDGEGSRVVVPGLVNRADIAQLADAWGVPHEALEDLKETGKSSPAFDSTVNGNWASSPDGLIKLAWLQEARGRVERDTTKKLIAGIDVAGPGEDETTLYMRQGPNLVHEQHWLDADPRGPLVEALGPHELYEIVNVDSAGIGYYLALHLIDLGYPVRMVNVGERSDDPEKYSNLKAQLFWGLRMRFEAGDVHGITDNVMIAQAASIKYKLNARGQVEIERKEELKKRIGKSPDRAEGLMLAFAYGDNAGSTAELNAAFRAAAELAAANAATAVQNVTQADARQDEARPDSYMTKEF